MYSKLFRSMYEGTLATKGPWQALVTFQQMLVLSDRFGVVDMTPEAISRITTIPQDIIETGIEELERPDSESRRDDFDGRRIVRLSDKRSWGWQIVNYEHYAKIRSAEERRDYHRQYMQEYRQRAHKENAKAPKRQPKSTPIGFDAFWAAYPNKKGKGAAIRAWTKLSPDAMTQATILDQLFAQRPTWTDPKFIPHPSKWLNDRRWEDEQPDYGACKFCSQPAVGQIQGVGHCAIDRHIDQARDWARNAK